jgi:hypothetical protein
MPTASMLFHLSANLFQPTVVALNPGNCRYELGARILRRVDQEPLEALSVRPYCRWHRIQVELDESHFIESIRPRRTAEGREVCQDDAR